MHVLFWNQEYRPSLGGVEVHTERLAVGLVARGHRVAVVTGRSSEKLAPYEIVDGVEVHRLPFYQVLTAREFRQIAALRQDVERLKAAFTPHIVHVNLTDASPVLHLMTQDPRTATIVAFHRAPSEFPSGWGLARALATRASALVAPSQQAASDAARVLELGATSVLAIMNGIPASTLDSKPLAISPSPSFAMAGRLVAEKGTDVAVRAVRRLHDEGIEASLYVAGAGDQTDVLRALVRDLGLAPHIHFPGRLTQAELFRILQGSTALLVPSMFEETFCQVAAEAAQAGRPVLASRIGALPETVVEGRTGLLFPPGDDKALSSLMLRLLREPGLARQLGEAALLHSRSNFGLKTMVDRYEQLYRSVLT
jgi:glycosyltransferase involved in cell wall biosynthesis